MDAFYTIVFTIAVVVLIIILTYFGITMQRSKNNDTKFPPTLSECPDYWEFDANGLCVVPSNKKNVGSIFDNTGSMTLKTDTTPGLSITDNGKKYSVNFNDNNWVAGGVTNVCKQKQWANKHGILWDGVSNYNSC